MLLCRLLAVAKKSSLPPKCIYTVDLITEYLAQQITILFFLFCHDSAILIWKPVQEHLCGTLHLGYLSVNVMHNFGFTNGKPWLFVAKDSTLCGLNSVTVTPHSQALCSKMRKLAVGFFQSSCQCCKLLWDLWNNFSL